MANTKPGAVKRQLSDDEINSLDVIRQNFGYKDNREALEWALSMSEYISWLVIDGKTIGTIEHREGSTFTVCVKQQTGTKKKAGGIYRV